MIPLRIHGSAGALTTASGFGLTSNQFAVTWNGFEIASSTLGSADLGLLNGNDFNSVEHFTHATSDIPLLNSGTAGHLALQSIISRNLRFQLTSNSIDNSDVLIGLPFRIKRSTFETRLSATRAFNNFSYLDPLKKVYDEDVQDFINPIVDQEWNNHERTSIQQFWSHKGKWNKSVNVWYQESFTRIPELMGSFGESQAVQEDQFLRLTTEWERRINENVKLNISAASFIDEQLYTDPEVGLISEINTSSNFLRTSTIHTFNSFIVKPTLNVQYKTAETENYNGSVRDWFIFSPGLALVKPINDYRFRLHFRYDQHSAFQSTPVADVSISKNVGALQWSLNGSRSQRMPTFNELFWQVDEPRDIRRELGWKVSQMTQWSMRKDNWKWITGMDLYWIQMQDMIQWISSEEGFVPRNLNEIENVSGDLKLEIQHLGKSMKGLRVNGNALRYIETPSWVDEEDAFRMYYRLNGTAFFSYKGWTLVGHLQSQQNLPIFSPNQRVEEEWVILYHGGIEKTIEFNQHQLQLKWFVRNITDQSLSILNAYAMPGRVMEMTINYTLKSKQTNEK
ncbi:MAG: hypothetical protein HRT74_05810 [Flavobacteriales bacterium]|nr:hypothetical protein [Flavobacteriales bacterium]